MSSPVFHSQKVITLLLRQLEKEFKASNSYFFASNWFSFKQYPGFASYFMKESIKEQQHGREINEYLLKRGVLPEIFPLKDYVPLKIAKDCPSEIFEFYCTQEKNNLESLNEISLEAFNCRDMLTVDFLSKFLKEQLDGYQEAEHLNHVAKIYVHMPQLYYHLDHKLGKK